MKIRVNYKSRVEEGFTLLEILLALSISGFLLLIIGSFFTTTMSSYSDSNNSIQIQQDIRLAILYISNEVRNADEIKLYNSLPDGLGDYNYIYLKNNSIKMKNPSGEKIINSGDITNLDFRIVPTDEETSPYKFYMQFSIAGNKGNSNYQLSDIKILLNNLDTNTSDNDNGTVIAYKKP